MASPAWLWAIICSLILGVTLSWAQDPASQSASLFRPYDGSFNNLIDSQRGAANRPLSYRFGYQNWSDAGFPLPNARSVSQNLFQSYFSLKTDYSHSMFFVFVGQLIMIDLVELEYDSSTSFINVPQCDYKFDPLCNGNANISYKKYYTNETDGSGRPLFRNRQASYIDCSFLYGLSAVGAEAQRTMKNGMLKMTSDNYLPLVDASTITKDRHYYIGPAPSDAKIFSAADLRINRNIGTQALTNLLAREHNRVAEETIRQYPFLSDENVFQIARKWVISVWQNIVTYRWGYYLLGEMFPKYNGYNETIDTTVSTAFVSAMQAFGLTITNSHFLPLKSKGDPLDVGVLSIKDSIYNSAMLLDIGIEAFIMGACTSPGGLSDPYVSDIFVGHHNGFAVDLSAVMLQHSRQMGIPSLNDLAKSYGYKEFRSISSISKSKNVKVRIAQLYPNNASRIEGFVGLMANDPELLQFGSPLTLLVVRDQLSRLMSGDRFYFRAPINNYSEVEVAKIRSSSFRSIVPLNTKLNQMPPSSFGVNNVIFQNFEATSAYKFIGENYANFSCRFSIEWKSYPEKISFDFCLSYVSGWFGLGFGSASPFYDMMMVILDGDKVTVEDFSTSNGELWRDSFLGGQNSLETQILEPDTKCKRKIRVTRKYLADDIYDRSILMNPATNMTRFLWAYSSPIATTNTFTPTASGEIEARLILLSPRNESIAVFAIRWSTKLILYHALLMFFSLFVLFPMAIYCQEFFANIPGWESVRNNLEGGALMIMLFGGASAYFGVECDFSYAHAYFGTATLIVALFSCTYGYMCREYWPSRGVYARNGHKRQLINYLISIVLASTTFLLGVKFATDIRPSLYWLYGAFPLWLAVLAVAFKFGQNINTVSTNGQSIWLKKFYIDKRNKFLKYFATIRTYPKFSLAQFQERVSSGASLAVYDGKICDLSAIYRIHPGSTDAVAANVGCDITRIFQGTFGRASQGKELATMGKIVTFTDRIKRDPRMKNQERESHLEEDMRKLREKVFKSLSIKHSSVAFRQLEAVFVGRLHVEPVETAVKSDKIEKPTPTKWYPSVFPKNESVAFPAIEPYKKTIGIFYDKKEEFEYNSLTEQSAYTFRFMFETPRHEVWLLPGDHVELSIPDDYGHATTMLVTPTVCHCENFISIHVKLYNGQKMSRLLESLHPGDLVAFRGPIPSPVSIVHREFSASGCAQQLLLLCAGAGITAGLQTIDYYLSFGPRNDDGIILSRIALVYFCRNENEIMLLDEIERLKKFACNRIDAFYVLTKSKTWRGPTGRVSRALLDTLVMPVLNVNEKHDMAFVDPDIEKKLSAIASLKPEAESRRGSMIGTPPQSKSLVDIETPGAQREIQPMGSLIRNSTANSTNVFEILGKETATYQVVICGPETFTRDAESSFAQLNVKHAKIAVLPSLK